MGSKDCGTTWEGAQKWSYEMRFDSEYTFIVSGSLHEFSESRSEPPASFGEDFVYVNAALPEYLGGPAQKNRWATLSLKWNSEASGPTRDMLLAVMEGAASIDTNV
jgi:hypothetical protein